MDHSVLNDVLVLLVCSVLVVAFMRKIHLTPILGYLFVGMAAGPNALSLVPDSEAIHLLSEIGLVFLLFSIGLEFSIPHFLSMRRTILGLGSSQVVLSTITGGLIAWYIGLSWQGALIAGAAMALSSTAIVVKQLNEQLEMQSRHGKNALGVLLFQDVAAIPFLVIIPILAVGEADALVIPLLIALIKGAVVFFIIAVLGYWGLRPLFEQVASARSAELFTLTALLVALAAAWMTQLFGLSLALGAFLAGMMLGESEYRHQIETDIRPFRDVLMGLFFISVGTQLDLANLPHIWHWVLLLVVGLIFGKGLLIMALTRFAGHEPGVAVRTGAVLGQGGEFGFALLALALSFNLLDTDDTQPILAALVLSMMLAPVIIRYNGQLAKRLCRQSYIHNRDRREERITEVTHDLQNHVIICGFGRIGQNLSGFLRSQGIVYVALDLDPVIIREASDAGEHIFFGDATHLNILQAAGLQRASALVVTSSDAYSAEKIIVAARSNTKNIPIIVRTVDDAKLEALEAAGASEVIPEAVEASMLLASHLLARLNVSENEVIRLVNQARDDHYRSLRCFFHGAEFDSIEEFEKYRLHTVVLPLNSYALGKTIVQLKFDKENISIHSITRNGVRCDEPSEDMRLDEGDSIVLQGLPEYLELAEEHLLRGA